MYAPKPEQCVRRGSFFPVLALTGGGQTMGWLHGGGLCLAIPGALEAVRNQTVATPPSFLLCDPAQSRRKEPRYHHAEYYSIRYEQPRKVIHWGSIMNLRLFWTTLGALVNLIHPALYRFLFLRGTHEGILWVLMEVPGRIFRVKVECNQPNSNRKNPSQSGGVIPNNQAVNPGMQLLPLTRNKLQNMDK